MALNVEELLKPIEGDDPAGPDLRVETGINSLYFKVKDARAQARTIERAIEAAGEQPTVPLEWQTVRALAVEALQHRSKDIEIAAWLLEALLRLEDFAGLATGFVLIRRLAETFWPGLHSIDEDDVAGRVSPLSGLNGMGSDGALVQPIRMVCLLPGGSYGSNALWHLPRVQKEPESAAAREFADARAAAGIAAIRDRAIQASAAREAFVELTATLDTLCGADAPPSSNIRNALDAVLDAYRSLIGGAEIPLEPGQASSTPPDAPSTAGVGAVASVEDVPASVIAVSREFGTREEAFAELLRIADFFRRMEPHSPLSFALETLVTRGRMTFVDLLEELMPDTEQRRQLLQRAGIHAATDGKSQQ